MLLSRRAFCGGLATERVGHNELLHVRPWHALHLKVASPYQAEQAMHVPCMWLVRGPECTITWPNDACSLTLPHCVVQGREDIGQITPGFAADFVGWKVGLV